ncbi:hypothetical protein GT034_35680, partial [Streptomyces sp. SID2563]|nr:hypothetical protein [Streptomyces sp. SID2563]
MTGSGGPGDLGEPADSGALGGGAAHADGLRAGGDPRAVAERRAASGAKAQADEDRAVAQALALVSRPSPRDAEPAPVDAPSDWLTSLHDDWPD